MPNFRNKFTTPSQEALLQQHLPWQYSVNNQGLLDPTKLKNINVTEDRLPRTYQDLLEAQKDNYFATAPAEHVVGEMRGVLGLKAEEVDNASPEQLEKWRQEIVKKINKQTIDMWNKDIAIPYKGKDAYKQITDVPGYKNKKGGIVTSLTRKEIDQYIKDGYII
jgi:basic membrane lipoprotein Med (substrate-binding protein (PBP1-ABC) superfamily)